MTPEVQIDLRISAFPSGVKEVRARVSLGDYSLDQCCLSEEQAIAFVGEVYFTLLRAGVVGGFREIADLLYPSPQKKGKASLTNGSSGDKEKSRHARGVSAPTATTR